MNDKEKVLDTIQTLAEMGYPSESIARHLGVDLEELEKEHLDTILRGRTEAAMAAYKLVKSEAFQGNSTALTALTRVVGISGRGTTPWSALKEKYKEGADLESILEHGVAPTNYISKKLVQEKMTTLALRNELTFDSLLEEDESVDGEANNG